MADRNITSRRGHLNGELINLEQAREIQHWTQVLGVTEEVLRVAIVEVGNSAGKVRQYLSYAGAVI